MLPLLASLAWFLAQNLSSKNENRKIHTTVLHRYWTYYKSIVHNLTTGIYNICNKVC